MKNIYPGIVRKITRCEVCGRRLIKGYSQLTPEADFPRATTIKVVCWRCRLSEWFRGIRERKTA